MMERSISLNKNRKRRNTWDSNSNETEHPKHISHLSVEQTETLLMRIRIEELTQAIQRQQSQNPRRGSTSLLDSLRHDDLVIDRHELIQRALNMDPTIVVPSDYKPYQRKVSAKIRIPTEKYPEYNFIGLIIGPRGLTQRRLEKDYFCKIAIRGKGSHKCSHDEHEPLHLLVIADSESQLQKASDAIKKMLVPLEPDESKRCALRSLACYGGTLISNDPNAPWNRPAEHPPWQISTNPSTYQQPTQAPPYNFEKEYEEFMKAIGGR